MGGRIGRLVTKDTAWAAPPVTGRTAGAFYRVTGGGMMAFRWTRHVLLALGMVAAVAVGVPLTRNHGLVMRRTAAAWPTAPRVLPAHIRQILLTSGTPAMVEYAPRNLDAVRSLIRLLVRGSTRAHPHIPGRVRFLSADYVGPPILYIGRGSSQVRLYPACYFVRYGPSGFKIVFIRDVLAVSRDRHITYIHAPGLYRWMLDAGWRRWFRLA